MASDELDQTTHGGDRPARARRGRALAAVRGPLRADLPHAAGAGAPGRAPARARRGDAGGDRGRRRRRQPRDPLGVHLLRSVRRPRHHVRPGLAAAAAQRPRRARRLPHAALRPRLGLRRRAEREPVPVRGARPALQRRQAARREKPENRPVPRRRRARQTGPAPQRAGPRADRRPAQRREHHRLAAPPRPPEAARPRRRPRPQHAETVRCGAVRGGAADRHLALPVGRRRGLPAADRRAGGRQRRAHERPQILRRGRTRRSCRSSSPPPPTASATR